MNIKKIYEDEYIFVLSKPSGLTVNRSKTEKNETLQDILEEAELAPRMAKEYGPIPSKEESDFVERLGIVHRLDKDTSGLIITAKDLESFKILQEQFKNHEIKKEYICLVFGEVKDELFEVNAPIKRSLNNRLKFAVVKEGKNAKTTFERLNTIANLTFLKALPHTGRTHQIRVHLLALGNPIVGDKTYSSAFQLKKALDLGYKRLMLHALKLGFYHPKTKVFIELEDTLPDDFKGCII